ncbi:MAG: hypothetical protein KBD78_07025, partial [Oligoflexales bacterium]|nr:hypothetical protein [Oligoflexales bacterium]
GFNNAGIDQLLRNISKNYNIPLPFGINIGKNKNTPIDKAIVDYQICLEKIGTTADYIVVNVSSPNTPDLRKLANNKFVIELAQLAGSQLKKVWIKLSPDIELQGFQSLIAVIQEQGFAGVILSNTKSVETPFSGGLSGPGLAAAAEQRLIEAWQVHLGGLPMISVGGISTGRDVLRRMQRGACAVQVYTALIYQGPWLVVQMLRELEQMLNDMKVKNINEVIGMHHR